MEVTRCENKINIEQFTHISQTSTAFSMLFRHVSVSVCISGFQSLLTRGQDREDLSTVLTFYHRMWATDKWYGDSYRFLSVRLNKEIVLSAAYQHSSAYSV